MTKSNSILKDFSSKLDNYSNKLDIEEIGIVTSVKDGIVQIEGLQNCKSQEMLLFEDNTIGLALNLKSDHVGAVVFGEFSNIKEGDTVRRTNRVMAVPVTDKLIGRVINPLGETIDGNGELEQAKYSSIEKIAPGVLQRSPVNQPLQTGIKAIDTLVPIGRGQRELILGDRQTGKTALAIDTIINQHDQDVICIYVAIGQKDSKVARMVSKLKETGALSHTIVVSAGASEPAPMLYLAPYTGVTIAEYFAEQGRDVLIIYDDLSKHAVAYRELSLLLRRPPGREAFPGDVFYLHSRLLERACKLNTKEGGGSITALPIIETQAGDLSAYIPTNVISITDGQIFLESDLFHRGIRPAINIGSSVSRVGSVAQIKPIKKVAGSLKLDLAQFRELEAFAQFSGDLDKETRKTIDRGQKLTELLKQKQYDPMPVEDQVVSIFAAGKGVFDEFDISDIKARESELIEYANTSRSGLMNQIKEGQWSEKIETELKELCKAFSFRYSSKETEPNDTEKQENSLEVTTKNK